MTDIEIPAAAASVGPRAASLAPDGIIAPPGNRGRLPMKSTCRARAMCLLLRPRRRRLPTVVDQVPKYGAPRRTGELRA